MYGYSLYFLFSFLHFADFISCLYLQWGIWALVQGRYSDNTGFDYVNYSNLLLTAYRKRKAEIFPDHI